MQALDGHDLRMLARELDQALEWVSATRAAGETVAGPSELSKRARKLERKLLAILLTGWQDAADEAITDAADTVLGGAGALSQSELDAVLGNVALRMGSSFSDDVMTDVRGVLGETYKVSRAWFAGVEPKNLSFNLVDRKAVSWLEGDAKYWIGGYYDRVLGAEIASGVAATILEEGLGRREAGGVLREALSERLLDDKVVGRAGYWEGLAAVAATRARTFGSIESFVEAGIARFEYVAVMDERTSKVCRELNGRIFDVATAVGVRDQMMQADDPEQVKTLMPWPKPGAVVGKSSAALAEEGVMMPPAHFRCRSMVVAIEDGDVEPVERRTPARTSARTREALDTVTPDEQALKLRTVRATATHAAFPSKQLAKAARVHATSELQFGETMTREAYLDRARETLASAPEVYMVGARDRSRVYYHVDPKARLVLTATDGGEIVSLNGMVGATDEQWARFRSNLRRRCVELRGVPTGDQAKSDGRTQQTHPEAG
jgi:SPP1 gp7 family putative phage head morphogenesis protein